MEKETEARPKPKKQQETETRPNQESALENIEKWVNSRGLQPPK